MTGTGRGTRNTPGHRTEDRVIPPATQRSMAERAGSTITEVAGSHVSMVSHPQAAIAAILAAVAAIGG